MTQYEEWKARGIDLREEKKKEYERRPETCVRHFAVPRLWAGAGMPPEPVTVADRQGEECCHERYRCTECRFYVPKEKKA